MHIIDIAIRNKIAVNTSKTEYICGNDDFIVMFDFDAEWDSFVHKTARFISNGGYVDVVFSGNECPVPVISNTYKIKVGVYAGDLRTTTPALIDARKSILCGTSVPAEPTPDVYAQMVALFNSGLDESRVNANASEAAKENAALSERNAKLSETNAAASEKAAAQSVTNAASSEKNAKTYEEAAAKSTETASKSATNAKASENAAALFASNASTSEKNANASASAAALSESRAAASAKQAEEAALKSNPSVFIATEEVTTYAEIKAAHDAGKVLFAERFLSSGKREVYAFSGFYETVFGDESTSRAQFTVMEHDQLTASSVSIGVMECDVSNKWTLATRRLWDFRSRVTAVNESSTDLQLPTAKAVYTAVKDATVLRSPNGTRFKITVDNNGTLTTTKMT